MTNLFLSLLLACSPAILSGAAEALSVSGTWQVHNNIAGNESDHPCTFVQDGNALKGSCRSREGEVKLSGSIEDKKVTWTYKSQYEGSPITVKYDGRLESATKIVGTVNVAEYGADGEFTATLSK